MLFKKAAVFTDIHFGKKSNSEVHNQDCLRFLGWFAEQVCQEQADCIIIIGDIFENRSFIGVDTLHYAVRGMELLSALNIPVYMVVGNHDMFYKNRRDIHSLSWMAHLPNFRIIDSLTEIDDVLFVPFLVGTEFVKVPEYRSTYVFGHFELPFFLLNEMIEMRDHGGLQSDHFVHPKMVFSGHFHKRQCKVNSNGIPIWYVGNTFPMDFNDVHDRERGCMILTHGEEPRFLDWEEAPNFHRTKMSQFLQSIDDQSFDSIYNKWSVVECHDDLNIALEDTLELKDQLQHLVREITIHPTQVETDISEGPVEEQPDEDIETMVINNLRKFDPKNDQIDPELLVTIFQGK